MDLIKTISGGTKSATSAQARINIGGLVDIDSPVSRRDNVRRVKSGNRTFFKLNVIKKN
jgi:hypothetical protein